MHHYGQPDELGPVANALQSACSVDRIDSALATVLPLVPGLSYFRFCCEDPRCGIELDEIDPEQWALLEVLSDPQAPVPASYSKHTQNMLIVHPAKLSCCELHCCKVPC